MKIIQINTVFKNGGSTGRIVYELKKITEKHGNEAYAAFGYEYQKTYDTNTYKMESILRLKLSILQTRLFAEHGFYNRWETQKLINWIDTIKPDLIHLHNLHGHYINIELLFEYIKDKQIPVIWTLHDCWAFTGWCAYFDYVGCSKWKSHCGQCPNKKEYPYSWFLDKSYQNYDRKKRCFQNVGNLTIVTPSKWLRGLVKESYLGKYDIEVINNGISLDIFYPRSTKIKDEIGIGSRKMILAVAMGMSKRKGIQYIYELSGKLDPDKECIVIVGMEKKQIKKVPEGIIGLTRINDVNRLAELYSAADVFINPTLQDTFPTTNLEALACGTPVVTFNTGGSPESIGDHCGAIVEKGNTQKLFDAVEEMLSQKKEVELCRTFAEKNFDKTRCFEKYMSLYKTVLER